MKAEIISVGTELLLGHTVNTDATHVARELSALGFDLLQVHTVGDNPQRLETALREALERAEVVITTGGLGPTEDDLTKETVALVANAPLEEHADSMARLREYFGTRPMSANQAKQGMLPRGAVAFPNLMGTAPGCATPAGDGRWVLMLPGPPSELLPMLRESAVPFLQRMSEAVIASFMVKTFGIGEGIAAQRIAGLTGGANPTAATYAGDAEMFVRVTAKAETAAAAEALAAPMVLGGLGSPVAMSVVKGLFAVGGGDDDPEKWVYDTIRKNLGGQAEELRMDIELVRGASHTFNREAYLEGKQCPVFFGSAVNNFGVQSLLDAVVELSPAPLARPAKSRMVEPIEPKFSGFVFKIQANMDPKHRDRIAFIRVCAGRFERGGKLKQVSTGKSLAINNAITFMAQDRNTTDEAWAGDIIGIPNHGTIHLGDTFTEGEDLQFTGIPSFAPEHFRRAQIKNPLKMKQLQKGLEQLAQEGATQLFRPTTTNELILGAVGTLQFDVVAHRLEFEYGVDVMFESCSYVTARWLRGSDADLKALADKSPANMAFDGNGDYVYLAPNRVNLQMAQERFPGIRFLETREIY